MTEFIHSHGNEVEQYLKIHSSFHHLIESYSFQSHLPYIPKQVQYKLQQYYSLIQQLLQLRTIILTNSINHLLQKYYQSWEQKNLLHSSYTTETTTIGSEYYHYQIQKLPIGSNQVIPELANHRFLLSRIAWLLSQLYFHYNYTMNEYERNLKESYLWYPKNAQVCYQLGELYKVIAVNEERLKESEFYFRRSLTIGMTILSTTSTTTGSNGVVEPKYKENEVSYAEKSGESLLLLLYQTNRYEEANDILQQTNKYQWKINEDLLSFSPSSTSMEVVGDSSDVRDRGIDDNNEDLPPIYYLQDHYLSNDMLTHLQSFFNNHSSFWLEHNYNFINNQSMISGYFSYLYPFTKRSALSSIEQIIDKIYQQLLLTHPIFQEATIAEWWVHTRPHCCGHQLHYDSDETRLEKGGCPNHPIASCVLYLSASELGGPTMISDQILDQSIGSQAWVVSPKENRLFVFNAKYLHGVMPGVGSIPTGKIDDRRLTFMVGFWRTIEAKDKGKDCIGAGQPYPLTMRVAPPRYPIQLEEEEDVKEEKDNKITRFTWPELLTPREEWKIDVKSIIPATQSMWKLENPKSFGVKKFAPLWKPVHVEKNDKGNNVLPGLNEDYQSFYQGF